MITSTTTSIVATINKYRLKHGGLKQQWYIGITSNPKNRLLNDHSIMAEHDPWIIMNAGSNTKARFIEKYLLSLGYCGGPGGGDSSTIYVYAYRKATHTKP